MSSADLPDQAILLQYFLQNSNKHQILNDRERKMLIIVQYKVWIRIIETKTKTERKMQIDELKQTESCNHSRNWTKLVNFNSLTDDFQIRVEHSLANIWRRNSKLDSL